MVEVNPARMTRSDGGLSSAEFSGGLIILKLCSTFLFLNFKLLQISKQHRLK